jgi:hypothetical protein
MSMQKALRCWPLLVLTAQGRHDEAQKVLHELRSLRDALLEQLWLLTQAIEL